MDIDALIESFTAAAQAGDGAAMAQLFTEDGVYHDGFYGAFEGAAAIRAMIERFHRDGERFKWQIYDAVRDGDIAYARYRFSYTSKLEGAAGKRVAFEGMCRLRLEGGKVRRYEEVFDTGVALAQLGFAPERIAKILARKAAALRSQDAFAEHLAG